MTWNKEGKELLAIGTSTGLVIVNDTQSPYKNVMQVKGHQGTNLTRLGDIKNIQWRPGCP